MTKAAGLEGDIFKKRRAEAIAFFGILAVLGLVSTFYARFNPALAISSIPKSLMWLFANFAPDSGALEKLPRIWDRLLQTISISIIATMVAMPGAFLFALAGSRVTGQSKPLALISRFIASLFRNIPVAAWAMVFLFSFGQTLFSGFLALALSSFGFLVRVFTECIDETSGEAVEALRASGASYFQTIFQAVVPDSLPQILSWILFTIETNIRSATLVGILTSTGIGFSFMLYYRSLNYKAAGLVVMAIVAAVLLIELISNAIRKVIL